MAYKIRKHPGRRHIVIPDTQSRPGVPNKHMAWAAYFILDKQPDAVIHLGDHADMPSLSRYTSSARKAWKQSTYQKDVDSALESMDIFVEILERHGAWSGLERHITLGNHENRITKWAEEDPTMAQFMSVEDLRYLQFGWRQHEFLAPVSVDGVLYSHYFPQNANGAVTNSRGAGSSSASAQVKALMTSCTAGHRQGLDIHNHPTPNGQRWGLIAGSFYLHDEDYLTPQGNNHWRGIIMKNDVRKGDYDPCFVSMDFLARKYGRYTRKGKNRW